MYKISDSNSKFIMFLRPTVQEKVLKNGDTLDRCDFGSFCAALGYVSVCVGVSYGENQLSSWN